MSTSQIDLYTLRCVTAALLWARHHPFELNADELKRLDVAVNHLVASRDELSGEIAASTGALLSEEPDHAGIRTIAAIDSLAELTAVNIDCAEALAALLSSSSTTPRVGFRTPHPSLFDHDSAVEGAASGGAA